MKWLWVLLALSACPKRAEPCVPPVLPPPTECCVSCAPVDVGCGVMACAPGSGLGCGPCPTFE